MIVVCNTCDVCGRAADVSGIDDCGDDWDACNDHANYRKERDAYELAQDDHVRTAFEKQAITVTEYGAIFHFPRQ